MGDWAVEGDAVPRMELGIALPIISSGKNAQDVVEVMSGFVASAHAGHVPVQLPLQRDSSVAPAKAAVEVASARL